MSRATPRRVQRAPGRVAPQRRLPKAVLPEVIEAVPEPILEPVLGPTLTLFETPETGAPATRRRGRPPGADTFDSPATATPGLREQPWPVSRRRGEAPDAKADADEGLAAVIPETCLSLLRANDRHDLPCPLVANAYRTEVDAAGAVHVHAKVNAPQRLREALRRPGLVARPIQLGTLADPYLSVERGQRLTRALLEILAEARHPVGLLTASPAVVRDLDLLADLGSRQQALVLMRIAPDVCPLGLVGELAPVGVAAPAPTRGRKAVPPAPGAAQREQLAASPWLTSLGRLAAAGVQVGVMLDVAADGVDTLALQAPNADPDRRAAWLALFTQLRAAGASLWRCVLPADRLADTLALGDLAASAGLSGQLPTLDVRPFVAPAAVVPAGPRQVTLF